MEYRTFETILVELHAIGPEGLAAFRSRLRNLRDIGVPDVRKPGKGARVTYRLEDLFEAHLGLNLEQFGLPPQRVKTVIEGVRAKWLLHGLAPQNPLVDPWLCVTFFRVAEGRADGNYRMQIRIKPLEYCIHEIAELEAKFERATIFGLVNLARLTREILDRWYAITE